MKKAPILIARVSFYEKKSFLLGYAKTSIFTIKKCAQQICQMTTSCHSLSKFFGLICFTTFCTWFLVCPNLLSWSSFLKKVGFKGKTKALLNCDIKISTREGLKKMYFNEKKNCFNQFLCVFRLLWHGIGKWN